jgi:transcription termination factor Rho
MQRSSTRQEELILDETTLRQVWVLRRMSSLLGANSISSSEATEKVLERLAKTTTNAEFLATLAKDF